MMAAIRDMSARLLTAAEWMRRVSPIADTVGWTARLTAAAQDVESKVADFFARVRAA